MQRECTTTELVDEIKRLRKVLRDFYWEAQPFLPTHFAPESLRRARAAAQAALPEGDNHDG